VVVDGFNVRRDFDLDELKEQIKAKGVLNPLTVIAFKDDEGNEKYKLVDGERRYRATMLAISEGADIPYVRAMKARKDASTEELYIQQMMRNEGKKFTEYECAIMFRRFKEEFGYSQVEIADKFKKSPAFISKCLSLLDLPPYIQERIMKGELSVKANKTKNTDLFLIDPRNIVVVDGFNVRRDFDLDELKEQIKAKGVLNPLTVIAFKDDEGNEKYKLVDGERRYRATMLAISEGADIPYVRAMKARKDASTEELYIQQMMRNEGKKFTEYECAIMFRRFKEEFGYSQVEIADKFKKSPAFISKCLSLLDLPPYIQERIMKGELSVKAAKEIAANYGSEKEQVKAAKSAVDNAKENGRVTATNKEVLNSLKDSKEAKAIAEALRKVWAYLDGEVIVDVDKLARLLDKTESLSQAMREYKKGGIK